MLCFATSCKKGKPEKREASVCLRFWCALSFRAFDWDAVYSQSGLRAQTLRKGTEGLRNLLSVGDREHKACGKRAQRLRSGLEHNEGAMHRRWGQKFGDSRREGAEMLIFLRICVMLRVNIS